MVADEDSRMAIEDELIDRFGDIPAPVENLIQIAQLRGATRKLGVSHLFLKPDGMHFKLDEKHMPPLDLLFEAVSRSDPRFRFDVGKKPGLVLSQRGMTAESALKEAIPLMQKVLDHIKQLRQDRPDGQDEQQVKLP